MTANSTRTCSDDSFGPTSCTRQFDFTLTFEQSILSILPSALLLLITPVRLIQLYRRDSKTLPGNRSYALKTITAAVNFGVQLALVIIWSTSSVIQTPTSIPSAALSLVDSLMVLCLSYAEDRKSTKPSSLLNIYLLFSILFEATEVRTLWLTHRANVAAAQSASIGIKISLLCLEAQAKTSYLKPPYNRYPPEATSGILNASFVWWLNKLFVAGFRKLITSQDLFKIDTGLGSESLRNRLKLAWDRYSKSEKFALPKAVAYCFRWNLLAVVFPRLCIIGFTFAQPFLITAAIQYLEAPDSTENKNHGYGLIGAAFLIYLGLAISRVHFNRCSNRVITMFRGAMISLIYDRALTLQSGVFQDGAAITLMSTDTDNIIEFLEKINDIWASSVEIAIGIWLLERQIGATCVVPLILSLVCVVGQGAVAKSIGQDQQNWNQAIQTRVKTTSTMLGSMKALKISGMGSLISRYVQRQREDELRLSRPFFWGILWLNGLANAPMIWSPVISFIVFAIQASVKGQSSLTTVQAFTSLSIITLVTSPASKLLAVVPQIAASLGCFERIQKYLLSASTHDTRCPLTAPATLNSRIEYKSNDVPKPGEFELSQISGPPMSSSCAIDIKHATIFPAADAKTAAIKDVSSTFESASLTVVLGSVGSGKTVLMKAILGELPCISGSIAVSSKHISYCSQTPWLLNTSIRKNIIGPILEKWNEEWYNAVVYACDLREDFQRLPDGEQSVIGSRGLMLSGGQKQRVALARAVYARPDIILLDDTLSALDTKTKDLISTRLLSTTGLLKRLGSTVILVTHSARFFDLADKIIILNSEGKVSIQGSHAELDRNEDLSALVKAQIITPTDDHSDGGQVSTSENESDEQQKERGSENPESTELMDITRRTGDMKVYAYYFRRIGMPLLLCYLAAQAVSAFMDNFPQVWLNWWTKFGGERLPLYLSVYAALALVASSSLLVCIWIVFLNLMPRSAIRLHKTLLDTVMCAPLSFFASTDTGVSLNRFSQDMSLVDLALPIAMSSTGAALFDCIAQIALISTGSSYMAITIPFTAIAIYCIQDMYLKTSRQLRFLDLENKSPLYSHFLETLEGITTIRAFGWEHTAIETQDMNLDHSQKPYYMLLCIQRWLNLVLDLMVTALAVIVVALAVQLRSTTSAGLIGIALNNMLGFNKSLSSLVTSWTSLETSLGAIARVKTFAETTPSENLPGENVQPFSAWPTSGAIRIEDVSATYSNSVVALDKINMDIVSGQKIGICGRTGSGKSSLVLALLRLIDISAGKIIIDGIDISTLSRNLIRERLIAIPQDTFTLPGSVRSNADPEGVATDTEIITALTKIGIWSTLEQRGGLDAILEEQPLSQGQQQLFCLVRAMLRKSKILILDEATSNLDSETDRVAQKVIREEFQGYTVITVAHKLETIMDSDKIAVFGAGKLLEFDSPGNLLARNSNFRQMQRF